MTPTTGFHGITRYLPSLILTNEFDMIDCPGCRHSLKSISLFLMATALRSQKCSTSSWKLFISEQKSNMFCLVPKTYQQSQNKNQLFFCTRKKSKHQKVASSEEVSYLPSTLLTMAIRVVELSNRGYKIRKLFA